MSRQVQADESTSIRGARAVKYFSPDVLSPWHRFSWKLRTRVTANVTSRRNGEEKRRKKEVKRKREKKEKHMETFQQLTEIFQ